jgi:hypothetical protein
MLSNEIVRRLLCSLKDGPPISESTWYKCALNGDRELVSPLLTHKTGSSVFYRGPLIAAINKGYTYIVVLLLENGIKVTSKAVTQACSGG